jgi:hypothetical protein
MAYSTGTGANQQDLLDAVRAFGLGLGWTIVEWDTVNKRLKMSKGVCKIGLTWANFNVNSYSGYLGTLTVISNGSISGSLTSSLTAGTTIQSEPGSSGNNTDAGWGFSHGLQGPYTGWFLFSNATGDYIHVVVQTSADVYVHFGFGNADKGGLSHSGVAYFYGDSGPIYWRDNSASLPSNDATEYNDPGLIGALWNTTSYYAYQASFQLLAVDALPAGFVNNVAHPSYYNATYNYRDTSIAAPMKTKSVANSSPSEYPALVSADQGARLLDNVIELSAPGHTSYVPMHGVPFIISNSARTSAVAVGACPDWRYINMTGMSPQQEITLGSDVWKVFPVRRQSAWTEAKVVESLQSGQFAVALKKIP